MLKKLKETVKRVKKMMCEQNRNIDKDRKLNEKPKGNSGDQKYKNRNEKLRRGFENLDLNRQKKESVKLKTGNC